MKFIKYEPKEANNCIIRTFLKITNKDFREIESELNNIAKNLNYKTYSEIEVFEKYISQLGFKKKNINKEIMIKDIKNISEKTIIFCYDKKNYYHLVAIENDTLYDKSMDTMNLYIISIYEMTC